MVKRESPTEEDLDRLAENMFNSEGDTILDRDSFDLAWGRYLTIASENFSESEKTRVFDKVRKRRPEISGERIFKAADGKSLTRDQLRLAKTVITDPKEYEKLKAQNVDLKGFDTPKQTIFSTVGRKKGRIIYGRRVGVIIKGKKIIRYRDKKGQFISVKIK